MKRVRDWRTRPALLGVVGALLLALTAVGTAAATTTHFAFGMVPSSGAVTAGCLGGATGAVHIKREAIAATGERTRMPS
jgi:hypothetical protein